MEIGGTGEVRRGGKIVQAGTRKSPGGTLRPAGQKDKLALSQQVVALLEERNQQLMAKAEEDGGDAQKKLLKAMEKDLKKMNKCQRIYARVANGDKVPPEDLQYLERCDPEGFKLALAMRRPKPNPKEWKSELDDEDREELAKGEDMSISKNPGQNG